MLILFGLILSDQIHFRRINGWQQIVEVVYEDSRKGVRKTRSVG